MTDDPVERKLMGMLNLLPQPYEMQFMTFFFVMIRVAGTVFAMPVFGGQTVPRPVRAGLAFWIALVLAGPYLGINEAANGYGIPPATQLYSGVLDFVLTAIGEFAIGFGLSFIFQVLLGAIGMSGEIIGKQAGFSAASVFDPITGQDNFLIAQIKVWIGTMLFLIIGGPELILQALANSFRVIPPGAGISLAAISKAGYQTIIVGEEPRHAVMSILFIMGIRIALPMIGCMLLVSLAEAFIARTAPQLNIMSVGFAIRMSMALFILSNLIVYIVITFKPHLMLYPWFSGQFLGRLTPS